MWDALAAWFSSAAGQRVIASILVPAAAIIVAGVVAGLIARSAVRGLLVRADRAAAAAAVAALVEAARVSGDWPRADAEERRRVDRLRTEADVRVRLLPRRGAALAAEWTMLRIEALQATREPNGATRAEVDEVRERLLAWTAHPSRAKRLFAEDVQRLTAARTHRAEPPAPVAPEPPGDETEPPAEPAEAPRPAEAAPQSAPAEAPVVAPAMAPEDEEPPSTEPMTVQRSRSAESPQPDPARPTPAEPARHALEPDAPRPPAPARAATPAWLDDYDDDADVTRDMDLKTPPPVAASSVRDRRHTGDDILPRH